MKKLLVVLSAMALLGGCNTIAGIGQDMQKAGEAVQEAVKKK